VRGGVSPLDRLLPDAVAAIAVDRLSTPIRRELD
jgi:hypothetical protein